MTQSAGVGCWPAQWKQVLNHWTVFLQFKEEWESRVESLFYYKICYFHEQKPVKVQLVIHIADPNG